MKCIHFPTLIFHGAMLLFAALTINGYPGTFLPVAAVALILHAIWCARSRQPMAWTHIPGCAVQFFIFLTGLIDVNSGAFGLGGGEFALFFHYINLTVSCCVELVIGLFRRKK